MKEHAAVVNTADVFEGASLNHREKKNDTPTTMRKREDCRLTTTTAIQNCRVTGICNNLCFSFFRFFPQGIAACGVQIIASLAHNKLKAEDTGACFFIPLL